MKCPRLGKRCSVRVGSRRKSLWGKDLRAARPAPVSISHCHVRVYVDKSEACAIMGVGLVDYLMGVYCHTLYFKIAPDAHSQLI